jgi:hypothetical protein
MRLRSSECFTLKISVKALLRPNANKLKWRYLTECEGYENPEISEIS